MLVKQVSSFPGGQTGMQLLHTLCSPEQTQLPELLEEVPGGPDCVAKGLKALKALILPVPIGLLGSVVTGSTLFLKIVLISSVVRFGFLAKSSAINPDTKGPA